jgi:hypothetical protein
MGDAAQLKQSKLIKFGSSTPLWTEVQYANDLAI